MPHITSGPKELGWTSISVVSTACEPDFYGTDAALKAVDPVVVAFPFTGDSRLLVFLISTRLSSVPFVTYF